MSKQQEQTSDTSGVSYTMQYNSFKYYLLLIISVLTTFIIASSYNMMTDAFYNRNLDILTVYSMLHNSYKYVASLYLSYLGVCLLLVLLTVLAANKYAKPKRFTKSNLVYVALASLILLELDGMFVLYSTIGLIYLLTSIIRSQKLDEFNDISTLNSKLDTEHKIESNNKVSKRKV